MELAALKEEIDHVQYVGLSDQQIASLVNAKTVSVRVLVPNWKIKEYAIANQFWPAIVMAALDTSTPTQVRAVAISARDWIDDQAGEVKNTDLDLASTQALVGALVATTLMPAEKVAGLNAMADLTISWLAANGLPSEIGPGLIEAARRA